MVPTLLLRASISIHPGYVWRNEALKAHESRYFALSEKDTSRCRKAGLRTQVGSNTSPVSGSSSQAMRYLPDFSSRMSRIFQNLSGTTSESTPLSSDSRCKWRARVAFFVFFVLFLGVLEFEVYRRLRKEGIICVVPLRRDGRDVEE